ncbi:hypothetical protein JYT61_01120, partial [bacterium AH-315-E10]|nr:hypothetical protein [bacterium AH-315-E10]
RNKKTYSDVKVLDVKPDHILIIHGEGVSKLHLRYLSRELQRKYNYNPKAAANYSSRQKVARTKQLLEQKRQLVQFSKAEMLKPRTFIELLKKVPVKQRGDFDKLWTQVQLVMAEEWINKKMKGFNYKGSGIFDFAAVTEDYDIKLEEGEVAKRYVVAVVNEKEKNRRISYFIKTTIAMDINEAEMIAGLKGPHIRLKRQVPGDRVNLIGVLSRVEFQRMYFLDEKSEKRGYGPMGVEVDVYINLTHLYR